MDRESLTQELQSMVSEYLQVQGIELVELTSRQEGPNFIVRILADKPQGGISIAECSKLNKELGSIFELKNSIPTQYLLEVSSPGLDRSLRTKNDFLRCINKEVRFFLNTVLNGKLEWAGLILDADDQSVYIEVNGAKMIVPLAAINKAKQIIDEH